MEEDAVCLHLQVDVNFVGVILQWMPSGETFFLYLHNLQQLFKIFTVKILNLIAIRGTNLFNRRVSVLTVGQSLRS